jgi:KDO2-lipid IV(A) lauroyltransferase
VADAARYMHELEAVVRECPGQYLWAHRRFKTRPPGEAPVY